MDTDDRYLIYAMQGLWYGSLPGLVLGSLNISGSVYVTLIGSLVGIGLGIWRCRHA